MNLQAPKLFPSNGFISQLKLNDSEWKRRQEKNLVEDGPEGGILKSDQSSPSRTMVFRILTRSRAKSRDIQGNISSVYPFFDRVRTAKTQNPNFEQRPLYPRPNRPALPQAKRTTQYDRRRTSVVYQNDANRELSTDLTKVGCLMRAPQSFQRFLLDSIGGSHASGSRLKKR